MMMTPGSYISLERSKDTGNEQMLPFGNSLKSNRMMRPCYEDEAFGFLSVFQKFYYHVKMGW